MHVYVRCPECATTLRTQPDQLGRRGRCAGCDLVFRLATPVGRCIGDDEPDAPQVIEEPPVQAKSNPQREPLPPDDDDEPPVERRRRRTEPQPSRVPWVPLAVLATLCFVGFSVAGFFLLRAIVTPNEPAAAPAPVPQPDPQPAPPAVKNDPTGVERPPVEPIRPPKPVRPAAPFALPLDGPVAGLYTGGGGRYIVFHLSAPRRLVVYDVAAGKFVSTVEGFEQNVQIAVGREKLYVGRWSDARITKYDLRTGAREAVGGPAPPERLGHLAIGSGSDGPLVSGTNSPDGKFNARLFDGDTLAPIGAAIDDPARTGEARSFPFTQALGTAHIAVSTDGRAVSLIDRLYTRTATGYRATPINMSSGIRPTPDGRVLTGNAILNDDGQWNRIEDRGNRWIVPAANGPFFMGFEYGQGRPVRLMLHSTRDGKIIGELPGRDDVAEWQGRSPGAVISLYRHLAFLPEPGLVVFAPTGAREARVFPVDLPALMAKSGIDVTFTTVPPVAVPKDRVYSYAASAVARDGGDVTFALESGPAGMKVAADGQLAWAAGPGYDQPTADVRLIARTADGKQVVQSFRLFLPAK